MVEGAGDTRTNPSIFLRLNRTDTRAADRVAGVPRPLRADHLDLRAQARRAAAGP